MRSILAIVNVLGALLAMFSAYYLLPVATALVYGEQAALLAFASCGVVTLALGGALLLATRRHRAELKPRDGYLLVSLSWLLPPNPSGSSWAFRSPTPTSRPCRGCRPRAHR
jgi:trk system potassium uptake protein TrkH